MANFVNNPKKQLTLNMPYDEAMKKLKLVGKWSQYFKAVDEEQTNVGIYTYHFKKPYAGLVDLGMTATIAATANGTDKTDIEIEVGDNFGAIDDNFDLDSAQTIMKDLIAGVSKVQKMDTQAVTAETKTVSADVKAVQEENSSNAIWAVVGVIALVVFVFIIA